MRATLRRFGLEAVKAVASVSSLDLAKEITIMHLLTFTEALSLPGEGGDKEFPGNSPGESNSKQADVGISESGGKQVGSSVCEGGGEESGVGGGEGGRQGVFPSFGQGNPEEGSTHPVGEGSGQQVGLCLGQGNL